MSDEIKNETVWGVTILALMMILSAGVMMFGGQDTELPNEDKVSAAAFHQDEYQIQYTMDFFRAGVWDNGDKMVVNDAVTSSEGVTYIVGTMYGANWLFDGISGSTADVEKGFVAALTSAGEWSWVRVDTSSNGTSSLNAVDLTTTNNLIVGGTFIGETSWLNTIGGYDHLYGLGSGNSPFAFNMGGDGDVTWLESLRGSAYRLNNADLNDIVVNGDAVYATGTSHGVMFWQDSKQTMGDYFGDAYVVKFSIHDGLVSHAVDSCTENDDNNMDGNGYCNSDVQTIPRESGYAITVIKDGSLLVGVSYDNSTTFGTSSTGEMSEAPDLILPYSDAAVWKLGSGLFSVDFSTFQTDQSDMVVGIEELEEGKYYLATNANGFQGRLLEIDVDLQLRHTHTANSGNLKILDITVDSGKLELVGFGAADIDGNKFIFEDQAYNPTNNASMFVAEYSDSGFEHGQAMDLPPTQSGEFLFPPTTTSITSQDGSIRVVTVSLPVWVYSPTAGPQISSQPKPISFGGTDTMVRPNTGIVGHFEWDTDQDGIPNRLDNYNDNIDPDHDGHANDVDNCPNDWNPQQDNNDNQDDGGDACDDDDDNDGVLDTNDSCPFIHAGDLDEDGDGCPDEILVGCMDDTAHNYTNLANSNSTTCDYDWDNDGTNDDDEIVGCMDDTADNFDPDATDPGQCNFTPSCPDCSVDGDDDEDGVPNETDQCPETPGGTPVLPDGCGEDGTVDPQGNASIWGAIGDCDPTNTSVNCQEEMIIAAAGGAGLFGGSIITRVLRPGRGKIKGPGLGIGDIADAKDAYDFIAKKDSKKVKKIGGSDHYFKPGVERQGAMSTAADTALDDYVED